MYFYHSVTTLPRGRLHVCRVGGLLELLILIQKEPVLGANKHDISLTRHSGNLPVDLSAVLVDTIICLHKNVHVLATHPTFNRIV
jgi:hypothetical protein